MLELLVIEEPQLKNKTSMVRRFLNDPRIDLYEILKSRDRVSRSRPIMSSEGAVAVEAFERFLATYHAIKDQIASNEILTNSFGVRRAFIDIYSIFVAASVGLSCIEGYSTEPLPIIGKHRLDFSKGAYIVLDELVGSFLKGTAAATTGQDLARYAQDYFQWIIGETLNEKNNERYSQLVEQVEKLTVELNGFKITGFGEIQKPGRSSQNKAGDPTITLASVGGNKEAKAEVEYIIKDWKNPMIYRKWGTRRPNGLLFYGPPGTGKTLLAQALANEIGLPFDEVEIKQIVSKWYGESTQNLAKRLAGEGIFFFDELDTLGRDRSADTNEATATLVNVLATTMDGFDSDKNKLYIAATNRPQDIDKALRRPGRFDKIVRFNYPDKDDLREIFEIHLAKSEVYAKEKFPERRLIGDMNKEEIIKTMFGLGNFVGAEVREVVRMTFEYKARQEHDGLNPDLPTTEDFLVQLNLYNENRYLRL